MACREVWRRSKLWREAEGGGGKLRRGRSAKNAVGKLNSGT